MIKVNLISAKMFSKKKRNGLQKKENQKQYLWKTISLKLKKNKSLRKDDITRNTSLKDGLCYTGSMEWGYIA